MAWVVDGHGVARSALAGPAQAPMLPLRSCSCCMEAAGRAATRHRCIRTATTSKRTAIGRGSSLTRSATSRNSIDYLDAIAQQERLGGDPVIAYGISSGWNRRGRAGQRRAASTVVSTWSALRTSTTPGFLPVGLVIMLLANMSEAEKQSASPYWRLLGQQHAASCCNATSWTRSRPTTSARVTPPLAQQRQSRHDAPSDAQRSCSMAGRSRPSPRLGTSPVARRPAAGHRGFRVRSRCCLPCCCSGPARSASQGAFQERRA